MGHKLAASAAVAIFIASWSGGSWAAGDKGKKKEKDGIPDAVSQQLSWEEKVVGPKDKGVDHKKIAAMQEKARREDAARQSEPPPKKTRAQGVAAPATSTLPTMDIEKPAPAGSAKKPAKRQAAVAEAPRQKDAIDNILSEETGPKSSASGGRAGLNNVFASSDAPRPAAHVTKKAAVSKKKRRHN
jgi:hypothetical protein